MIEIVIPIPYSLTSAGFLLFATYLFAAVSVVRLLAAIWDALPLV